MFSHPTIINNNDRKYNKEVYQQLQFLKSKMHDGEGERMQASYPEGYLFLHALYGLSWANCTKNLAKNAPIYQEAIKELQWAIARMESDTAKAIFQKDLYLPYGVFYQAWLNYTRAQYLNLQNDAIQKERFQKSCEQIVAAVNHHYTPFLYSYSSGCWPADNIVALATLNMHDKLFSTKYTSSKAKWLESIKTKLDKNGLIPHSVNLGQGNTIEQAKGSSQSLMLAFLLDIDPVFAKTQYQQYKKLFIDQRFGLPGIREFPNGVKGYPDIDSGPIILDIGGAASLVGMGTCGQFGDMALYNGLRNSIRAFGMSYNWQGKKRYLFGKLPIMDAFIAWSHSRVPLEYFEKKKGL